jgi:hypothetical protein
MNLASRNTALRIHSLFCILGLLLSAAISRAGDPPDYRKWRANLRRRNPVAEARINVANRKIYVLSAMGYALTFPGIDQELGVRLKEQYGAKLLKGTSDAIENDAHKAYLETAGKFASAYNRELVKLLGLPPKE